MEKLRLLRGMVEKQEKTVRLTKILASVEIGLLAVIILIFVLLVPSLFKMIKNMESTMEHVNVLMEQAESSMTEITELAGDADLLIQENQTEIQTAIKNFNSVDFESLNRSISSLAEVMEPILELLDIMS